MHLFTIRDTIDINHDTNQKKHFNEEGQSLLYVTLRYFTLLYITLCYFMLLYISLLLFQL